MECKACANVKTIDGACISACPPMHYTDKSRTCFSCHYECNEGCAGACSLLS